MLHGRVSDHHERINKWYTSRDGWLFWQYIHLIDVFINNSLPTASYEEIFLQDSLKKSWRNVSSIY